MLSQTESPIYFKIPSELKEQFDTVCRRSKTTKTTELFRFIKGYIDEVKVSDPSLLETRDWTVKQNTQTKEEIFKPFWWER